ncbi:D heavy chain constant region transmembrane form [Podarcis lilfordi]|uniref:D heavy chain constant region transmembrane form n=1 Tax=Podarcis lilfordi TaxID=74358 RepID=A0AA35L7N3_9SAUR|nr:D heavy chain constant region transmembrane form [Podarcis lilfordi]
MKLTEEGFDVLLATWIFVPPDSNDAPLVFPLMPCCDSDENKADVTFACLLAANMINLATIEWQPSNSQAKMFPATQQKIGSRFYSASQLTVHSEELKTKSYQCLVNQKPEKEVRPSATIHYNDCTLQARKPIQVNILTPSCGEQAAETSLDLVCFLRSLGPGKAYVEWLRNGEVEQGRVQVSLAADQGKSSSYSRFVQRNITKESWDRGDIYTCKVARSVRSPDIIMYNTSKCQACYASLLKPTVSIIKPSYRDVVEGTANVTCAVVGFGLENIEVTWDVDGKPSTMGQKTMRGKDASGEQEIKNTHMISLEQWRKGTRFTCKVAGGCYEEVIKQLTIKKETQTMEPSITVSKANFDVSLQSTVALILVCNVNGFSPEEISISWKKDNNILNETLYDNGPVTPAGKGYTTYSILKIGRDEAGGKGGSYSCVVHHSSSNQPLTKSEKVPIDQLQAPTVEILQSIDQENKTITLKCIASNYRPPNVSIEWKAGPQNKKVTFVERKMADGTYSSSKQLKMPISQWQEVEINTCEVVHEATNTKVVRNISRKDWIVPTALSLTLSTDPLCPSTGLGNSGNITLVCSIYGNSLENIQVTWEASGKAQEAPKPANLLKNAGQFYTRSNLVVPLKEWNTLQKYTCKARQPGTNSIQTSSISKCTACKGSVPPPSLYLLKPPLEKLLTQSKALFICLVVGYELDHAMLTWMVNGINHTKNAEKANITSHTNLTQSLQSQLTITREAWDSGNAIQCLISHPCSFFPDMKQTIQKNKDSNHVKAPSFNLVILSPRQFIHPTSQAVAWLACEVSGFSPAEIFIRWKKNDTDIDVSEYITGPPTAQAGSPTFTIQSILKVPASEWRSRALYSCIVGHESLTLMKNASEHLYDFLQPAPPQVTAFHTSEDGGSQKLVCFATDFYPKNIDIEWATKGHRLSCSPNSSALVPLGNGKFQKTCSWVLSGEEWREPEIYTCTVNHSSTNTMIKKDLHHSGMAPLLNKTAIKMQPPLFEDLFINKSAILTCMMPLANATINSTVSWTMDGEPADTKAVTTTFLNETNSTSWIYGQLRVNLTEWKTTVKFTCSIQNGLGETKQHFERRNGTMKPPKVYLQQQSSNDDLNVTLFCVVRDFYPGEIFVKWEEEKKGMSLKGYDAHGLKCDHEKQRCSLVSILEVPTSKWLTGVSYACLVAHVSSENITIRRTNSLSDSWDCAIMGAALCDIRNENEDEYSELEEANSVWNKVSTFMVLFTVAIFYGGLVTFIKVK